MSTPIQAPHSSLPSVLSGPSRPIPEDATVHAAIFAHARSNPHAPALRTADSTVSYAGLARHAQGVRQELDRHGVRPGTVVPVLAESSGPMITAELGILAAGATFAALDPHWPAERIAGAIEDCGASLVLDPGSFPHSYPGVQIVPMPPVPDGDEAPVGIYDSKQVPSAAPACVFFTSGSTGRPKGVVIPHRAFVRTFHKPGFADFDSSTVFLHAAPPYWDAMALEVFGALMNGGCVVPAPERLLTPDRLGDLITRQGVNTAWLTASLFNVLVDEGLEAFTGLHALMIGGERLSEPHVGRFLAAHPCVRLTNGYGPVESMVFAATHLIDERDLDRPDGIPLGCPLRNTTVWVCDESEQVVPRGEPGELVIAGDGLALGYLARPDEERRRFSETILPGGTTARAYRSGDRVYMDTEGLLHYLGRTDRQFKIRGYRVEPGEVERVVSTWPDIPTAVVLPVREALGTVTATVCAYTTTSGCPISERRLEQQAEDSLPAHIRPGRYVHLEEFPLGPTGKMDFNALTALTQQPAVPAQAPPSAPVALTAVRDILGLASLEAGDDIFRAGADSLHVLRLAGRLTAIAGTRISPADVYRAPTAEALEDLLRTDRAGIRRSAAPAAGHLTLATSHTPLTPGQRRFWFAESLAPGASAHVAVTRIRLRGPLDRRRLARALADVTARHPALRTVFPRTGAFPSPQVLPPAPVPIQWYSAADTTEDRVISHLAAQVHDVAHGPLIAAGGIRLGELEHQLLVCVHHIAYDAESEAVLLQDLADHYADRMPSPVTPGPRHSAAAPEDQERLRSFWTAQLANLPVLDHPDSSPLPVRTLWTRKQTVTPIALRTVSPQRLRVAAAEFRTPILAFFLTAWWRVLTRHTSSSDHAIGTAVARADDEAAHSIGYRANNVPIRIALSPEQSAVVQLPAVRDRLLDALAHAEFPTDEIAALAPRPPAGRMPLYQSMLLLQRVAPPRSAGDLELIAQPRIPLGPQCELLIEIWEGNDGFTCHLLSPEEFLPQSRLDHLASDFAAEVSAALDWHASAAPGAV